MNFLNWNFNLILSYLFINFRIFKNLNIEVKFNISYKTMQNI